MIELKSTNSVVTELEADSWALLLLASLLLILLLTSYLLHQFKTRYRLKSAWIVHESLLAITLGLLVGWFLGQRQPPSENQTVSGSEEFSRILAFDQHYFFYLLLPPIIFESGFGLQGKTYFFANIGSICGFAFLGTIISTICIGVPLWILSSIEMTGITISLTDCLIFGSFLSSTDPVAVLSIFSSLGVDPSLLSIVFGESVLNDSVAIILFSTLSRYQGTDWMSFSQIILGIGNFLGAFFGSLTIGVFLALVCSLFLKHSMIREHPSLESSFVFVLSYFIYVFSNALALSGIVSLLFGAVTLKHYGYPNLSLRSRRTLKYMSRVLCQLCENFIFVYLGISFFSMHEHYKFGLVFWTFILVLVARWCGVFSVATLINLICHQKDGISSSSSTNSSQNDINPFPRNYQYMLWWAGLRGPIAFALSFQMGGSSAPFIRTTTLIICVISILGLGGSVSYALNLLNIPHDLGVNSKVEKTRRDAEFLKYLDVYEDNAEDATDSSSEEGDIEEDSGPLASHHYHRSPSPEARIPHSSQQNDEYQVGFFQFSKMPHRLSTDEMIAPTTRNQMPTTLNSTPPIGQHEQMTNWFIYYDKLWFKPFFTREPLSKRGAVFASRRVRSLRMEDGPPSSATLTPDDGV